MSTQEQRTPVTVRLDNPDLAQVDRLARDEQRDRSQMIRVLIRQALATRRKAMQSITDQEAP